MVDTFIDPMQEEPTAEELSNAPASEDSDLNTLVELDLTDQDPDAPVDYDSATPATLLEMPDEGGLREHDENLLNLPGFVDDVQLTQIVEDAIHNYESDCAARSEWEEIYEKGIKSLKPREQDLESNQRASARGLSQVIHPVMAEVAVEFQAKAIAELYDPTRPVGIKIVGNATPEILDQSYRVEDYMNYQITEEMSEFFPEHDQMLLHLPLTGMAYKRAFFDPLENRTSSRFVRAKDFVNAATASDLKTSERYTWMIRLQPNEWYGYVEEEFYNELEPEVNPMSTEDHSIDAELSGVAPPAEDENGEVVLLEQHVYLDLDDKGRRPYILTIHKATEQAVALRRNWREDDVKERKIVWFVEYRFLPGLGPNGFGLYHIIGSLGQSATGALRALLDSANYANLQGGFKLKSRTQGGEFQIAPGEFVDVDALVDDINKAVMPLPFKEPSATLMQLLQYIVETAKRFANAADSGIADANQNTPVGTTVALMEEQGKVFSAIHKRLHLAQSQEFKLIAELNGMYLPKRYPYRVEGKDSFVMRKDFDGRVDVIPVSDPRTFSSTQRIAQAQAMLQTAEKYPQFHDIPAAIRRMYEAMRIPNFEEILIDPADVSRQDAVTENSMIMMNRPVRAYVDQDHMAHMTVLDKWFESLPPEAQQIFMQSYISHRSEHMSYLYRVQVQNQLGAPLPPLPDLQTRGKKIPDTDVQLDAQISAAAAQVTNNNPQSMIGPPPPAPPQDPNQMQQQPGQPNPELEAQAMMIKAQTQAQIDMQKAQQDMQIRQAEAQMQQRIRMMNEETEAKIKEMRAQQDLFQDQKEFDQKIEALWEKNDADIAMMREKAFAQIQLNDKVQREKADAVKRSAGGSGNQRGSGNDNSSS